jgi:hypothetical protein
MRSKYLWVIGCTVAALYLSNNCVNAQMQMPGMGMMGGGGNTQGGSTGMGGGALPPDTRDAPSAAAPAATKVNPFAPDAMPVEGSKEKTNAMEKFIFGHSQPSQKLDKRVARLEKRLLPYEHHKGKEDLDQRVDHLWTIMSNANGAPKSPRPDKPDKDDKK